MKSIEQAAEEYANGYYPIKAYVNYESDYDYRTQCANNIQVREHFIAGSKYREWISKKPEFTEECTLVTASKYNRNDENLDWDYAVWQIKKLDGENEDGNYGWYWGVLNGDGEEYGDLEDLAAGKYLILPPIKK